MTFKPLDLQMSVPRTQEFGSMHQQALQKPLSEQNILANQATKLTEELRKQNTAVEQSSKSQVRADQESNQSNLHKKSKRSQDKENKDEESCESPAHPYKGHRLDIKL
ncbi:hypothetical protein I6N90_02180 [Paenibacillus sp. GSMTC-2017]|uniref:hypothetical protein n=1 Tax=Paenibacillus sp. GSMTC-2017 TaxID=2794350 RepID=UPI0018D6EC44|nr:hypothetical protein [Paenibacillus sp. GSMTC-2017]MBH5316614.1 hypothetical protein [Paenibacillus sp. GSMTC-2017]